MCGSTGIPIHFEPDIVGARWIWCTNCGRIGSPATMRWSSDEAYGPPVNVGRNPNGEDKTYSPHTPNCPRCGEGDIIGEATYDGSLLRLKDEPILYPRRETKNGKKPIPPAWVEVKPYKTKKGTFSSYKPDYKDVIRQETIYDRFQERVSVIFSGDDLDGNLGELLDIYGDVKVSMGVYNLSSRPGLIVLRDRKVWHGVRRLGWRRDAKTKKWFDLERVNLWLNEKGFSMNRGYFVVDRDVNSDTYQCAFWYDPSESKYVMVADTDHGWTKCGYDESQGRDDSDEDWKVKAMEGDDVPVEEGSDEEPFEDSESEAA